MLYVKVVTLLVLKRWVWPMIKCSHLTPKSIYSYIDDLVIANCLIDARMVVHALSHISVAILSCEHVGCIIYSFEDIHLLFWLFGSFFFCQVDGQECLRTFSSYLCYSCLKLYSCYITKFDQVRFEPLCVRSTRSPRFIIDLNFQNLFVRFGLTDSSILVIPRSLSWSSFSISVQLIWTFRSHRVSVTACSYESRCHRVVPLGHTDRVRLYISPGQILENFPKPLCPRIAPSASSGRWIVLLVASTPTPLVSAAVNGILSRRCRRSKFTAALGSELETLC